MFILSSTSDLVQVITGSGITVDVHASYVDWNGTAATPDRKNTAITTATTTTVVGSPGSSVQRTVKLLTVKNKHASSSVAVTVQHTDGTTPAQLPKVTLLAGELLIINEAGTLFMYDVNGAVKTAITPVDPRTNDFRLSGVTATPVMTADSTTLSTIFLSQFKGNRIALYDGANWNLLTPASEQSLAVSGRTTDLPFDIFCFNSAGTPTLEFLDWTNATTRATGLTRVDGVWTKTGDSTRRYLGSCRARSATTFHFQQGGTDVPCKYDLFNADNRVAHRFTLKDGSTSHTYTTATWRQWQASTNYQVDIMVGLQEESFEAEAQASSRNSTISIPRQVGIGFDTTTAFTGTTAATANTVASIEACQVAKVANQPTIGRHFYALVQISTATGTCTWVGTDGASRLQSGVTGSWTC